MLLGIWGNGNRGAFKRITKKARYKARGRGWLLGEPGVLTPPYPSWPWTLGQRNLGRECSVDSSKFKSFGVLVSNVICPCWLEGGVLGMLLSPLGDSVSSVKP